MHYEVVNLTFTYPTRETAALSDVSLAIGRGEFVTLCGPSGCGKTTLLRHLKPSATPHGVRSGEVFFDGAPLGNLSVRDAAAKIGFVFQSPENQIVTDKVWHELAFGLESLGMKTPEIRLRVAEMASFFGIQEWFYKPVAELSGGQKQMLALASIMALQPSALILDEPTGQLDPIAAGEFLATICKINRELGVTVILTEQRLEEALPMSDRAIVMDSGRVIADGAPREVGLQLRGQGSGMFLAMPTAMRVWNSIDNGQLTMDNCPITVRDGAVWLWRFVINDERLTINDEELTVDDSSKGVGLGKAVELFGVWFKYARDLPDVVRGLSFEARYGEITAILGGNGTGKTTALMLAGGVYKPYRGKAAVSGQVFMLPQNPQSLFVAKTVREDLLEALSDQWQGDVGSKRKLSKDEKTSLLAAMVRLCRLEGLLDFHPYDLSGGEQQRAALAKVLLLQPEILLLDEPTKGLDAEFKQVFAAILKKLAAAGVAVVMASHDVEFCAEHADRCALFFDGSIVTENTPRAFFSGNSFYTTSANRMGRDILPHAVTAEDIVLAIGGKWKVESGKRKVLDEGAKRGEVRGEREEERGKRREDNGVWAALDWDAGYGAGDAIAVSQPKNAPGLSMPRKIIACAFAALLLAAGLFAAVNLNSFRAFINGGNVAVSVADEGAALYVGIMLAFAVGVAGFVFTLAYKREERAAPQKLADKRKLSKRTVAAAALILLAIPLTMLVGTYVFGDRRYYFISLLIILQTMLPFALVFEGRKPQARELVVIAVLCAIAVAGRAAFFMLPQFKPVVALVIIAGVAFGGEAGFLVGAMTGFVSNFFFGQGPWTPYQMFAFGVIGFLSGVLFRKGLLRRAPMPLAVFGALATFIIYGGIMNPAHVLMYQSAPTRAMFLAAYLQGIPFDLVHAAATVMFLTVISRPMLEKLDRIKVKYGLVE